MAGRARLQVEGAAGLNPETRSRLNEDALTGAREAHFERLTALFAGERLDLLFVLQGVGKTLDVSADVEPEEQMASALDALAEQAERALDPHVFRPLCVSSGPYGVHFIDRMLGARVYHQDDQWWSEPLPTAVGELRPPDLAGNATWAVARRHAEAFLAAEVTVPLFGMPTIASALNIAVNLYGEGLLMAMLSEPKAARHDLGVINSLLRTLHEWSLDALPPEQLQPVVPAGRCQPRGFGQLCGCTSHLLSAEQYREFIAPLDDALLRVYPHGGMIHLCGAHTQHIPVWREMRSVRAIQVNDRAAEDLETYFRELRDDQILYLNPTPTMTVEQAMAITGGHRLVLVADVPEPLPVRPQSRA